MKNRFKVSLVSAAYTALLAGCNLDINDNDDDNQNNQAKAIDVTILHMNDHHSHIAADSFDFDVSTLSLSAKAENDAAINEVEVTYGGFPMLVSLFEQEAANHKNVLKLHSGDAITGTLYYSLYKGEADAAMMNQVCFDAFALGNHEFDDGDSGLANFLDELSSGSCETPVLAANVSPADDSAIKAGYIQPYTIIKKEGEKIGIVGIDIAGKTKNSSQPDDGTVFLDETTTAQQYIDELTDMGVNKIILLTHYQYENDLAMVANLEGVDVVVGGDSHTLLGDSTFSDLGFNPVGQYPTRVTDKMGNQVCVVQAWEYAHIMGKLDVSFDKAGHVVSCQGEPLMPVSDQFAYEFSDSETRELSEQDKMLVSQALTQHSEVVVTQADTATSTLIADYDQQVNELTQQVIGTVATDLCLDRFPGQARSTLCDATATYEYGSDISNVVAKAFMMVTPTADIGIQNAGGVRVDVAAGDFTIADAFTLLPFSNTLVTLEMTGQQIVDVLEDALANTLDNEGSTGSYPYASGLRFNVDASAAKGSRVSNVEVNPRVAASWTTIDLNTTYTVVTNDFIASGQDGYATFGTVFNSGDYVDTYTEYAQGLIDYAEMLSEDNMTIDKLPAEEYSTQNYIGRDACNHSTDTDCTGY
ncbi:bifunctional metallophosphatase/5'-nucleotidase [Catenovulum adriaticum]|uniref:5'-nucleotidase C-terminal domain-containing protein n=1 Tax=Catenovulum adriaticum TaxID=2984846 RepID=A0ABY7ANX4_9ALTE|nr:5'-nucleotidase C-terminal domain-containing protein [Catenovulum sp. TS8]WAJ71268.1 5'-nucleotidase C-terminal domain-containing protein [Catenovulum sp. TS8]